jgi:hypothetical protein
MLHGYMGAIGQELVEATMLRWLNFRRIIDSVIRHSAILIEWVPSYAAYDKAEF